MKNTCFLNCFLFGNNFLQVWFSGVFLSPCLVDDGFSWTSELSFTIGVWVKNERGSRDDVWWLGDPRVSSLSRLPSKS